MILPNWQQNNTKIKTQKCNIFWNRFIYSNTSSPSAPCASPKSVARNRSEPLVWDFYAATGFIWSIGQGTESILYKGKYWKYWKLQTPNLLRLIRPLLHTSIGNTDILDRVLPNLSNSIFNSKVITRIE